MKKKIIVFSCIAIMLTMYFAIPLNASITPLQTSSYNTAYTYSDAPIRFWGYFGAEDTLTYQTSNFTKQNANMIGTNAYNNIEKPIVWTALSAHRFKRFDVETTMPTSVISNEYNQYPNGTYRVRFGVWIRCYDSNYVSDVNILAHIQIGEGDNQVYQPMTYIQTPNDIRGRYYYFDATINYNEKYDGQNIYIGFIAEAKESTGVLFPGGEPAYNNAFLGLTKIYFDKIDINSLEPPYQKGAIIQYVNNTLILSNYQVVNEPFENPFTNQSVSGNGYPLLLTNESNPNFAYYYVPQYTTTAQGWLYECYVLPKGIIDNSQINSSNYQEAINNAYEEGKKSNIGIVNDLRAQLNNLDEYYFQKTLSYEEEIKQLRVQISRLSSGNSISFREGYDQGYLAATTTADNLSKSIDSLGNFVRLGISAVGSYGIYGITISTVVVVSVIALLSIKVIKAFK